MSPAKTETGFEEILRVARVLSYTRSGAFEGLSAEEILRVLRAIRATDFDIFADVLTREEIAHAAKHGALSEACLKSLEAAY